MGHRREDLTSFPVLFWPVGAYLIIYRAEGHPIKAHRPVVSVVRANKRSLR